MQAVGSILIASSEEESEALRQRQQLLQAAGLQVSFLPAAEAQHLEPALQLSAAGSGLLVLTDVQVSGRAAAAAMQQACEVHGPRFLPLFHEPVQQLVAGPSGRRVEGVQTAARRWGGFKECCTCCI